MWGTNVNEKLSVSNVILRIVRNIHLPWDCPEQIFIQTYCSLHLTLQALVPFTILADVALLYVNTIGQPTIKEILDELSLPKIKLARSWWKRRFKVWWTVFKWIFSVMITFDAKESLIICWLSESTWLLVEQSIFRSASKYPGCGTFSSDVYTKCSCFAQENIANGDRSFIVK